MTRLPGARLDEYAAVLARAEAFFARVAERYASHMRCGAGCAECCQVELSLSPLEAEALARFVESLPAPERARLAARAAAGRAQPSPAPARCAALDDDGRCAVYAARPVVCRTHGVPMRLPVAARGAAPERARLPVITEATAEPGGEEELAVCRLNFEGMPLSRVAAECVLNLESIDALLALVNARACDEAGVDRLARAALRDVLFFAHP